MALFLRKSMNKLMTCLWITLCLPLLARAETVNPEDLNKLYSPRIVGDTLVIKGRIDSHIYDFLSREAKPIERVTRIELNSLGGNHTWALEVAKKIQLLGKTTVLPEGNFCASACVYLFAAGKERLAGKETWLGVHGARLGTGFVTAFQGACFVDLEDGSVFEPRKKGCKDFLAEWYGKAMKATADAFDLMESNGVSRALRETYFAMPDDEKWYEQANVIRKPDWFLVAPEAVKYALVTSLAEVASVDKPAPAAPRAE
jgi:hypothetical protein